MEGIDKEKRIAILTAVFAFLSMKRRSRRPGAKTQLKAWRLSRAMYEDPIAGY